MKTAFVTFHADTPPKLERQMNDWLAALPEDAVVGDVHFQACTDGEDYDYTALVRVQMAGNGGLAPSNYA